MELYTENKLLSDIIYEKIIPDLISDKKDTDLEISANNINIFEMTISAIEISESTEVLKKLSKQGDNYDIQKAINVFVIILLCEILDNCSEEDIVYFFKKFIKFINKNDCVTPSSNTFFDKAVKKLAKNDKQKNIIIRATIEYLNTVEDFDIRGNILNIITDYIIDDRSQITEFIKNYDLAKNDTIEHQKYCLFMVQLAFQQQDKNSKIDESFFSSHDIASNIKYFLFSSNNYHLKNSAGWALAWLWDCIYIESLEIRKPLIPIDNEINSKIISDHDFGKYDLLNYRYAQLLSINFKTIESQIGFPRLFELIEKKESIKLPKQVIDKNLENSFIKLYDSTKNEKYRNLIALRAASIGINSYKFVNSLIAIIQSYRHDEGKNIYYPIYNNFQVRASIYALIYKKNSKIIDKVKNLLDNKVENISKNAQIILKCLNFSSYYDTESLYNYILKNFYGSFCYKVSGVDITGRQAWYFVLIDYSKVDSFLEKKKGSSYNLEDYGKIIVSGYGEEVPEDVKEMLKETYDFNNF